jgi:hypothetical protein
VLEQDALERQLGGPAGSELDVGRGEQLRPSTIAAISTPACGTTASP